MNLGISAVVANLGVVFEWIVCLVLLLGSLIFMAKSVVLGFLINFFTFSVVFVWFYLAGLNYVIPLALSLIFMVLMFLSLFYYDKVSSWGVVG